MSSQPLPLKYWRRVSVSSAITVVVMAVKSNPLRMILFIMWV